MNRSDSALTKDLHTYRPQGTGWVAYYDLAAIHKPAGLAMVWRMPDNDLRWVAAYERPNRGAVTEAGRIGEWQHVWDVMGEALKQERPNRVRAEFETLSILLPHADIRRTVPAPEGLPPLEEHLALVRRAVAEADLTPVVRQAYLACLDRGVPRDLPLSKLRERSHSGEWPALTLATRQPDLVRAVLAAEPQVLSGADPLANVRNRWPGLTQPHLARIAEGCPKGLGLAATWGKGVGNTLSLLNHIPVDWWPSQEGWGAFGIAANIVDVLSGACGPAVTPAPLVAASKGDWPAFLRRLMRAAGAEPGPQGTDLSVHASDCADPVRALMEGLMIPLVASRQDEDGVMGLEYRFGEVNARARFGESDALLIAARAAASTLLYGGKSAPAILETSRYWHARQAVMQADLRGRDGETAWPPLFEGEFRHGDVGIVALKDYAALREEGSSRPDRDGVPGLDHCVASRLSDCLSGKGHILSVRLHAPDGTWTRLSTCQVSAGAMDGGSCRISVTEHRGDGNAEAPEGAVEAVSRLSRAMLTGQLPAGPQALTPRESQAGGSITRACGYDWRDPEALARAVLTWEPFLPRWARGLGPDGLYDALAERDILPVPEPDAATPSMG